MRLLLIRGGFVGLSWSCLSLAIAQAAPPATGDILRQTEQVVPQAPIDRKGMTIELPRPFRPLSGGVQVVVRDLEIRGNTLISADALRGVVRARLGTPLDMAGLRLLTDELAAYYADRGYPFVRIYLPEQDLGLGILQLVVVEGRYGAIRIEPGQNLPAGLAFDRQVEPAIQSFLSRIQVGDFIRGPDLERSTLLLDDQPGVKVTPIIQPGEALGTGDLMIRYQRTAPMTAEVVLDSHGSRFTGARRAKVDLSWNSPFVFGDQLRLIGMLSEGGLHLGSVAYSRLVSGEGLRIRASYSYTDYQLGQDYASLKRSGVVQIPSIGLSYPIVRSQATNLTLSLNLQRKTFLDYDGLQLTRERKESQSAPITAQFDFRDQLLGGGINYGYLTLTPGQLKLEGTALATDQSTARTNGAFTKGELDFSRLQALPGALSLSLRWYQQLTLRKNLDASEGVSFGGPTGVRAYPVGEGSGDSGQLLQIELRHTLQGYIAYTFFDQARVKINARAYDSSVNYREFSGAGFGLRANRGLADGKAITGDAVLAWSTGGGASQSDSRVRSPRVWLSGGYRF